MENLTWHLRSILLISLTATAPVLVTTQYWPMIIRTSRLTMTLTYQTSALALDHRNVFSINESTVSTSVTPSNFFSINDSISSMPYSKYNKSTIIDNSYLSSTPLPTPQNNASSITLSYMNDAKTRNTNNKIDAKKNWIKNWINSIKLSIQAV